MLPSTVKLPACRMARICWLDTDRSSCILRKSTGLKYQLFKNTISSTSRIALALRVSKTVREASPSETSPENCRTPPEEMNSSPDSKREVNSSEIHKERLPVNWKNTIFHDLGFDNKLYAESGGTRCRQHVNPLKRELQIPAEAPKWNEIYEKPDRPLILDIGSGYGRFLLAMAKSFPNANCLGLEIRKPAVDRANRWAKHLDLQGRTNFLLANATVSLTNMLDSEENPYSGALDLVTIQFPDPHFKKRHKKRRIVQPQLVKALTALMPKGGKVFLQSDVLDVAEDMRDQFERYGGDHFELSSEHAKTNVFYESSILEDGAQEEGNSWSSTWAKFGWLKDNPLPIPTERETLVVSQNLPVYRVLLNKL